MRTLLLVFVLICITQGAFAQHQAKATIAGTGGSLFFFDDSVAGKKIAISILDAEGWSYRAHHVCLATDDCGRTKKRLRTAGGKLIGQPDFPTQMTLLGFKSSKGTRAFTVMDIPCEGGVAARRATVVSQVNKMGCFGGYTLLGRALIENQYLGDVDGWRRIAQQTFQTQQKGKWVTDFSIYLEDFSYGREVISDGFNFGEHVLIKRGDGTILHDETSDSWVIPGSSSESVSKVERCDAYAKSRSGIVQLAETVAGGVCQNMWESGLLGWIDGGSGSAGSEEGGFSIGFGLSISPPNPCGNLQQMYEPADMVLYDYLYNQCLNTPEPTTGDPDVNIDLSVLEEFDDDLVEIEQDDGAFPNMGGNSCPDKTTTFTMVIDGEQCTVTETTECDSDCNCDTTEVITCGG